VDHGKNNYAQFNPVNNAKPSSTHTKKAAIKPPFRAKHFATLY